MPTPTISNPLPRPCEMALTADRLVVIGRGRLLADTTVAGLTAAGAGSLEEGFFALTGESAEFRGTAEPRARR